MSPAPNPPGYWMNEAGGELAPAVMRYLDDASSLSVRDIRLIRAYLVQWINSPVWEANPHTSPAGRQELEELRLAAARIDTRRAIDEWIEVAADWGIDPL